MFFEIIFWHAMCLSSNCPSAISFKVKWLYHPDGYSKSNWSSMSKENIGITTQREKQVNLVPSLSFRDDGVSAVYNSAIKRDVRVAKEYTRSSQSRLCLHQSSEIRRFFCLSILSFLIMMSVRSENTPLDFNAWESAPFADDDAWEREKEPNTSWTNHTWLAWLQQEPNFSSFRRSFIECLWTREETYLE